MPSNSSTALWSPDDAETAILSEIQRKVGAIGTVVAAIGDPMAVGLRAAKPNKTTVEFDFTIKGQAGALVFAGVELDGTVKVSLEWDGNEAPQKRQSLVSAGPAFR